MKKIYFIEGIPGIGKTTLSQTIEYLLLQKSSNVKRYEEHSYENPLDITRKAFFSQVEYKKFVGRCVSLSEEGKYTADDIISEIESKTSFMGDYVIVSYLQPYFADKVIERELRQLYGNEVCNGHVSELEYTKIVYSLFLRFSEKSQDGFSYIFDGALFQNILLDMIGFYNCDTESLKHFYTKLFAALTSFEINILYLYDENIDALLNATNTERSEMNWLSNFNAWTIRTNWFQAQKNASLFPNAATAFCCNLQRVMVELTNSFTAIEKRYIKARYTTLDLKGVI